MSFPLNQTESLRSGCRRAARRELHKTLAQLKTMADRDETVHEVRRRIKRVRAILRFVRCGMPHKQYQRENRKLRNLARPLNDLRDGTVVLEALAEIPRSAQLSPVLESLAAQWRSEQQALEQRLIDDQQILATTAKGLRAARHRVRQWRIDLKGWKLLEAGLRESYQAGQHRFQAALLTPQPQPLHEWRKRAKHLYYQLQFLQSIAPDSIDPQVESFDRLTELLGQHHDLAMLSHRISDQQSLDTDNREELLTSLRVHADQLIRDAFAEGGPLYQQAADQFVDQMKRCWRQR